MTEKPILFNADMVRAIRDGRKTQTRRPMKDQPEEGCYRFSNVNNDLWMPVYKDKATHSLDEARRSPFGAPGDLLVPLTTWATLCQYNHLKPTDLPDYAPIFTPWDASVKWCPDYCKTKKRPGRFMPKKFRHLLPRLLVKRVWVERVQSITDADVVAEGIEQINIDKYRKFFDPRDVHGIAFGELWDSIYADKYPWADNPWVFGCEFKVTH